MYENADALLTGALAARRLDVSRQLIHYWRTCGALHVAADGDGGAPLYRLRDLLDVERDMRHAHQSHRGTPHKGAGHGVAPVS